MSSPEGQDWRSVFFHELGHRVFADWYRNVGSRELHRADVYSNAITGRRNGIFEAVKKLNPAVAPPLGRSFEPKRALRAEDQQGSTGFFGQARAEIGTHRARVHTEAMILAAYAASRELCQRQFRDPLSALNKTDLSAVLVRRFWYFYKPLASK